MIATAIGLPLFLCALWVLSGYLPTRHIAMPAFSVVATKTGYQIRQYEPYIIAETSLTSGPGGSGFKELFRYISGNNTGGSKLAMTAPVLKTSAAGGEKISFIMPPGLRLAELPQPKSPKVALREIPGHRAAVVRFSGVADSATLREKTALLLRALREDGLHIRSIPMIALYNPPWTPPFMRRNEIMVEIE